MKLIDRMADIVWEKATLKHVDNIYLLRRYLINYVSLIIMEIISVILTIKNELPIIFNSFIFSVIVLCIIAFVTIMFFIGSIKYYKSFKNNSINTN